MNAQVTAVGNLTRDPQVRDTKGNSKLITFAIGVRTTDKDATGQYKSQFFDVSYFTNTPQFLMDRLQKGSQVYVVGDLEGREYKDKDGNTRFSMSIRARSVDGLNRLKERGTAPVPAQHTAPAPEEGADDLPF